MSFSSDRELEAADNLLGATVQAYSRRNDLRGIPSQLLAFDEWNAAEETAAELEVAAQLPQHTGPLNRHHVRTKYSVHDTNIPSQPSKAMA